MKKLFLLFILLSTCSGLIAQNIDFESVQPKLTSMANISAFYEINDITYHKGIINDPPKALEYKGDKKVAANMGVYMADMIYGIGSKSLDANDSFGAVMELARKLGMEDAFTQVIIDRLNSEDIGASEAGKYLDEVLKVSEEKFTEDQQAEIYNFMLYGNYIEKLHLISSQLQKSKESDLPESAVANLNRSLLLLMARQGPPLKKLSKLMVDYSSNIVAHRDIQKLLGAYEELAKNRDKIVKMAPADMYEAKEIKAIQKQIAEIRERVVE